MMQNTIRFAKQPLRRLPLYIMTGVEGPVLATKQLYARGDSLGSEMPESAIGRPLNAQVNKVFCAWFVKCFPRPFVGSDSG